jgi:hypothetical protein
MGEASAGEIKLASREERLPVSLLRCRSLLLRRSRRDFGLLCPSWTAGEKRWEEKQVVADKRMN